MKLLFTSVGRRVELIQAFDRARRSLSLNLEIIGADATLDAPALFFCDTRLQLCPIREKAYIPSLLSYCKEAKIDALIPLIDTDLLLLAENRSRFFAVGTRVLTGGEDFVRICCDKRETGKFFASLDLCTPEAVDDAQNYRGRFPCFIKPVDGSSSIGAKKAESREELLAHAKTLKAYIVQPFIEGQEYTVDICCDFDGQPLCITPRVRLAVRAGEVLKSRIDMDTRIIECCKQIAKAAKPAGAITVQLIRETKSGKDYYIEINPRYGGGAPLSIMAGADSPEALLRLLCGEHTRDVCYEAKDGLIFSRFDQSICLQKRQSMKKVFSFSEIETAIDARIRGVIFDLDDTLHPEADYIKSGFLAAAEALPEFQDAYIRLWNAYRAGKPAFDTLFAEEGVCDITRKAHALSVYREHKPQLCLSSEAYDLLLSLRERGFKLGLITDGRPEGQRAKIESLGLKSLLDDFIITDELGGPQCRKPCDVAFRLLAARWGFSFHQLCYIGDNPRKDFAAPNALGMQSLWLLQKNKEG